MAFKQVAIIDNSVLAYAMELSSIDLLNALKSIFSFILIPDQIRIEFTHSLYSPQKEHRERFLDKINVDYGFYRRCVTYDPVVLDFVSNHKEIHEGEAEVIAQASKR